MPELTDDQLDGLFRKSGEEFDTPFDPAAWQDMKARLDANDRTTPSGALTWKSLLRWGLPVALLLLLTGGGWFFYHKANSGPKTTSSQKGVSSRTELMGTTKGISQAETPRLADAERLNTKPSGSTESKVNEVGQLADRGQAVDESGSPKNSSDKPGIDLKEKALPTMNEVKKPLPVEAIPTGLLARTKVSGATKSVTSSYRLKDADGQTHTNRSRLVKMPLVTNSAGILANRLSRTATSKTKGRVSSREQRNANRNPGAFSTAGYALSSQSSFTKRSVAEEKKTKQADVSSTGGNVAFPEPNEATSVVLPTINELAIRPAHWPKSLAFTGRPVEAQPDTTVQRVSPRLPPMRGLSVRFVVSPDLSTVGLKNFDRPGTNIGLLLEYRIASRWSIQAGVIKSTKVYRTSTEGYEWPEYILKWPLQPIGADGTCNMLDIPINVRYDVVVKPRLDGRLPSRWFVSSGVTSYYISKEAYSFSYADPNSPHIYSNMKSIAPPSTGGFGFSNLNLSVGYERSISRRLSWQVEPFMKVPLRGVGYFKIDLLSTGAFFSLRYKL